MEGPKKISEPLAELLRVSHDIKDIKACCLKVGTFQPQMASQLISDYNILLEASKSQFLDPSRPLKVNMICANILPTVFLISEI